MLTFPISLFLFWVYGNRPHLWVNMCVLLMECSLGYDMTISFFWSIFIKLMGRYDGQSIDNHQIMIIFFNHEVSIISFWKY